MTPASSAIPGKARLTPAKVKRESKIKKQARTEEILWRLEEEYPEARCALDHESPLQLLVASPSLPPDLASGLFPLLGMRR